MVCGGYQKLTFGFREGMGLVLVPLLLLLISLLLLLFVLLLGLLIAPKFSIKLRTCGMFNTAVIAAL